MEMKQYVVCALFGTALMLCLGGCNLEHNTVSSTTATLLAGTVETATDNRKAWEDTLEASSATEENIFSEPTQTEPLQTETATTEPLQTQPMPTEPAPTEATKTEPAQTEPTQTEPPQTEPVQVERIQAQPVIDRAVTALADRLSVASFDPGWIGGTVVTMPMELGLPEDEMAQKLLNWMQELFADALAGEDSPNDVTYTYNVSYNGVAEDNSSHLFVLSYTSIGQTAEQIPFDIAAVVAQVTRGVLNSTRVKVTAFAGNDYAHCVTIRQVPHFYSTQDAVECLINAVETEIYTQSILGGPCSEFCLVYGSEEETCHVFLLYLK